MQNLENKILASIIRDKKAFKFFKDAGIRPSYFQFPEQKQLYRICEYYYTKYDDPLTQDVLQVLFKRPDSKLSDTYKKRLTVLFEEIQSLKFDINLRVLADEFENYYKIHSAKRLLQDASKTLHENDPDKFLDVVRKNILNFEKDFAFDEESGFFGDNSDQLKEEYEDRKKNPDKYKGLNIGFEMFDKKTNGLKNGTVTLILGKMKASKSVFVLNVAYNLTSKGKRVLFHVNEGGKRLVEDRFISCGTGLGMSSIEKTKLNADEEKLYCGFLDKFNNSKLLFIDSVDSTGSYVDRVEDKIKEIKETSGPVDAVIVDYLGNMESRKKYTKSEWERMGIITKELKALAMRQNVPVITIAHINRPGMERDESKYELEDMGLSIEPLKHVDYILSWKIADEDAFDYDKMGEGVLSIIGSRHSSCGQVILDVNTNIMKIKDKRIKRIL